MVLGTLAPTLFNIYFSAVVASWQNEAGVDVLFRHGRKLEGDRTAKFRLNLTKITESQLCGFVYCHTLEQASRKFEGNESEWG